MTRFPRPVRQLLYTIALVIALRVCGCLPLGDTGAAPRPVRIEATPKVQFALHGKTTRVYLKLTVPKDTRNRAVCVEVDGGIYRSSCWEITALGQAYRQEWWVGELVAGAYEVRATLTREDGRQDVDRTTFCVAGSEGECGLGEGP